MLKRTTISFVVLLRVYEWLKLIRQGRLLVPKDLAVFASISGNVVLSSAVNIIEIWDKDLYEKAIDNSVGDFADLAEEVMGDINFDDNGIS